MVGLFKQPSLLVNNMSPSPIFCCSMLLFCPWDLKLPQTLTTYTGNQLIQVWKGDFHPCRSFLHGKFYNKIYSVFKPNWHRAQKIRNMLIFSTTWRSVNFKMSFWHLQFPPKHRTKTSLTKPLNSYISILHNLDVGKSESFLRRQLMIANYRVKKFVRKSQQSQQTQTHLSKHCCFQDKTWLKMPKWAIFLISSKSK